MPDAQDMPWDPGELEAAARACLPAAAALYYETTAVHPPSRDNEEAWASWRFVPRVGVDVSTISTATRLLGGELETPILLAPCAFAGYGHPDGEWAVGRAAARAGVPYVVSSASSKPAMSVPSAAGGARCWLQAYLPASADEERSLISNADASGFEAIVVTLDAPVGSLRRVGYTPDASERDPFERGRPAGSPLNPAVTWARLAELAGMTPLPLLVKGVLHPDDGRLAVDHGATGVIVSNHGSRQLEGVVPTAVVLEEIATAVGDRAAVMVDGGIRSGRDVLRALCLGADAVLIGRPYLWALAVAGEAGIELLLKRMRLELENALALTGCRTALDASRALVRWHPPSPSGPLPRAGPPS